MSTGSEHRALPRKSYDEAEDQNTRARVRRRKRFTRARASLRREADANIIDLTGAIAKRRAAARRSAVELWVGGASWIRTLG